ncbi:MAG: 16S rRNA (uracil(1498)-N(3))-methyltransferase [Verrucomicrobiales bacterium]|jgi:16S rRNA (uracil1498-N3)-methyltransferase|nr:16S rRNA (uracil(1498)-N(3))-methyltransferase [Verrucomicrobiales bacterium]
MTRFYCPTISDGALDRAEAHHARKVLRLTVGDECEVFDGNGAVARARLTVVGKQAVQFATVSVSRQPAPDYRIILGQAIPKAKAWDFILQKATELGLSELYPLATANAVVQIGDADRDAKHEKWRQTLIEACKQCGQNYLPRLRPPQNLASFLAATAGFKGLKLIASLQPGAQPLAAALDAAADRAVLFLIGPEGDFTAEETNLSVSAGFIPVTLGPLVLRVETAALFTLSALTHHLAR